LDKLQLVPIAYLDVVRNRAHGRTAGGKIDTTWTESAGKATETEQFIVALPSYPAAEAAARAPAKAT
jgi:hypothetical protein